MLTVRTLLLILLPWTTVSACNTGNTPGYVGYSKLEPGTPYWVAYDANRRGGFILVEEYKDGEETKSLIKTCAEPPPDSVGTVDQGLDAKGGYAGAEGAIDIKNKTAVTVLAARSADIELLRESFFRLCELSLRAEWSPEELRKQYGLVLGVYKEVVASRAAAECFKAAAAKPELISECAKLTKPPAARNELGATSCVGYDCCAPESIAPAACSQSHANAPMTNFACTNGQCAWSLPASSSPQTCTCRMR